MQPAALAPLSLALLSALAWPQETSPVPSLEHLREHARTARPPQPGPLAAVGSAEVSDLEHDFELCFDDSGRVRLNVVGRLGESLAWDGMELWALDQRDGVAFELELWERDAEHVWLAVWSGAWARPGFPFELAGPDPSEGGLVLSVSSPRSSYVGTLFLDPETLHPMELVTTSWLGTQTWELADVEEGLARTVTVIDETGALDIFRVAQVSMGKDGIFARPAPASQNATFDPAVGPELDVSLAPGGHLIVPVLVNGVEARFLFDTGAAFATMDPELVEELGLERFGRRLLGGGGEEVSNTSLVQAERLHIGPLRLRAPVFTVMETPAGLGAADGIIGWEVLIQTVAEIDMETPALRLFEPDDHHLPDEDWRELLIHTRHPHLRARFDGDREGLFRFDTGAGRISVMFHSPAVQALGLLDGRRTTPMQARGAGGVVQLRVGRIDWFEVEGHRVEEPQVLFCMDEKGALADPDSVGNLGGGVVRPFVLVFDYQNGRVAFLER